MPINLGLLSERSLANQPEEVRQGLQEQATRQFLLNALMGGGLRGGFAASQAVPEQYQTQVEQRALDRAVAQAKERATRPQGIGLTQTGEGSQFDMLQAQNEGFDQGQMQGVNAATAQALQSNRNIPRQLDVAEYARQIPSILAQAGPRAKIGSLEKTLSTALQVAPQITDGVIRDPVSGQIVGFAPKRDLERGVQVINDVATPIQGFRGARIASTVPTFGPNIEPVLGPRGELSVRPIAGATQAVAQLEGATTGAREANIPRPMTTASGAPFFGFVTPPGAQPTAPTTVTPAAQPVGQQAPQPVGQAAGGVTGPTTAQAAVNAAYEPILKDAYAGFKLASGRSGTLQSLRNALANPNFDTNAFTPAKTALTSFLNATGVTGNNANQFLTSSSAFRQGLNTIAAQSVSELPGAISNFELQFAQSRFGTLTDPKQANLYAIDLMEVADKRKRDYYNFVQKNPRADVIDAWQNSPQGQKGIFEDPKLRKYLPARPVASGPNKGKTAYNLPSGEWVVFD